MNKRFDNGPVRSFRDLVAWQKSYALAIAVYRSTKAFPADERFALTSQIRRAAVAVASNIAEGYGRGGRSDYIRFLKIARGSLYELDTQLQLACDLTYLDQPAHAGLKSALNESERILAGLIRSLEAPEPVE